MFKEHQERDSDELDKSASKLISKYLKALADDYGQPDYFDAQYEIDQAKHTIQTLLLNTFSKDLERFTNMDELDMGEAAEVIERQRELFMQVRDTTLDLSQCVIEVPELLKNPMPPPRPILDPWLNTGGLAMIYGPRGIGKSWLGHLIAASLTGNNARDTEIGQRWKVKRGTGVMLIDGEMSGHEIGTRLEWLQSIMGSDYNGWPFLLLSSTHNQQIGMPSIDLTSAEWRSRISELIKEQENKKKVRLLILDNLASLCPGLDENNKQDWDPINQWMLSLRAIGVAVIYIHHAGKKGAQRGTSAREDALDVVLKLSKPRDYDPSMGAHFYISFDKSRNVRPDANISSFSLKVRDLPLDYED
jgi:putative DNA primase/helicase